MPAADPEFPPEAFAGKLVRCAEVDFDGDGPQTSNSRDIESLRLRPWTRAVGLFLGDCAPARRLALKIQASRKRERASSSPNHRIRSVEVTQE